METGTKQLWVCGSACLTSATRVRRSHRRNRLIKSLNLRIPSYSNLFQGGGPVQIKLPNEPIRNFIFPTAHQLLMPNTNRLETKNEPIFSADSGLPPPSARRPPASRELCPVVPGRAQSKQKENLFFEDSGELAL
ncbi:MAG: hypothetical protein JWM99_739 [Verrucomicrobiales bacterium]|nr:hypothetical protein [Verrucomicrobiales bacterium]